MIKPSTRLFAAIWLAVGFVLFRLVYAVVFSGASSGEVLVDLPGFGLGGIFSHVTLFGPIGVDGLLRTVASALPFAAAILAFGVISFFIGPEQIGRAAIRTKSNFLRALGVGVAVLPALAEAAKRISLALSYRSAPKRYALVPLLETAIARANAVSEALVVEKRLNPLNDEVLIAVDANTEIRLRATEALLVRGVTGSGKTTLLRSIAARALDKNRQGSVNVFGFDAIENAQAAASFSKYVAQQPRDSFLDWKANASMETAWLSEGEAVKQAISAALATKPKLLVLDEPYASLDAESCITLNRQLAEYREQGGILVVAEHETQRIDIPNAKLLHLGTEVTPSLTPRTVAVVGRDLVSEFEGTQINQGDLICVLGPNGVGKTSYLKRLLAHAKNHRLNARFIPERVEDMFLAQSLEQEFVLSDRLSKSKAGTTRAAFESLLPLTKEMLLTHPRDLSAGTKLVLALSIALALRPQLLLIDEPVKGLDGITRSLMAEVLACVQETGCAVLFATHDQAFAAIAKKSVELGSGVKKWSDSAR